MNKITLINGLLIYYQQAPHSRAFEIWFHVHTGSRDETVETNGVSHFLEHMLFRGSQNYPNSEALSEAMESLGGESNGMTSVDTTVYWLRGAATVFSKGLEVFADFILRPLIKNGVETERKIILQELANEFNETEINIDSETVAMDFLFGKSGLGLPILGTQKSLKNLTSQTLWNTYIQRYHPKNVVLTLTGPQAWAEIEPLVSKAFAVFPFASATPMLGHHRKPQALLHPPKSSPVRCIPNVDNQFTLKLIFPYTYHSYEETFAVSLIRRLLDDGSTSRLQSHIRENLGLVYDISCEHVVYSEVGMLFIDAIVSLENLEPLIQALQETLWELMTQGPTPSEMEHFSFRHRFYLESLPESPEQFFQREVFHTFHSVDISLEQEWECVARMTQPALRTLIQKILSSPTHRAVLIGPKARQYQTLLCDMLAALCKGDSSAP